MCPYCGSDLSDTIHEGSNYFVDDPTIYKCKNCLREYSEDEIEDSEDEEE